MEETFLLGYIVIMLYVSISYILSLLFSKITSNMSELIACRSGPLDNKILARNSISQLCSDLFVSPGTSVSPEVTTIDLLQTVEVECIVIKFDK